MNDNKLNVLWTSADPVTAKEMVLLYTVNSLKREWWDKVTVIIWGGATKLITENKNIQDLIKQGMEVGVNFVACLHCAQQVNAEEILTKIGVELKYMGKDLTEIIKSGEHLITV